MLKMKTIGRKKPVPQAKTEALVRAKVESVKPTTAAEVSAAAAKIPTLSAVMDTLRRRLGAPLLCHFKVVDDHMKRPKAVAAEIKYERMSKDVLVQAFADLQCEEALTKTGLGWGFTHQAIWVYVSEVFRVRFTARRYRDGSVVLLISTDFNTKAENEAAAVREAQRKAEAEKAEAAKLKADLATKQALRIAQATVENDEVEELADFDEE